MNKVLVVVDMQNDFIDGSLGTKEARAITPYVAEKIKDARKNGTHIVCTMDTHNEDYLDSNEGKMLPVRHCVIGTDGWKLNKDVLDALGEETAERMEKALMFFQYKKDAANGVLFRSEDDMGRFSVVYKGQFGSPDIAEEVMQCVAGFSLYNAYNKRYGDISDLEIELVGLCTDICVVSNALLLKTYFPEAKVVADSRGCAGVTPEKHEAALEVMRSCQIEII